MKTIAVSLVLLLGMVFAVHAVPPYVERELIVKFKPNTSQATRDQITRNFGTTVVKRFTRIRAYHLRMQQDGDVPALVARFLKHPAVEYAEPNYILQPYDIPNDALFPKLWGLNNTGQTGGTPDADIDAPEAWNITTGSPSVVVGVIDSGIDYTHNDLAANIWTNPGEIPANGIDDDGNGYVDDVHGYDFVNNDGDPMDDNSGHGTAVAGIIGAVGNNALGVVGVSRKVRLMALKFYNDIENASVSNAILAIEYATMMRANLTNNSWGGGAPSSALKDAIAASPLFVVAAGNIAQNNDQVPIFPANYPLENIIAVAATSSKDMLASFSDYGSLSVDLGAPGVAIWSTIPNNRYGSFNGTSLSTPYVSGVAALIFAVSPNASAIEVKDIILSTVDPVPSLAGKTVTGGRLNAAKALARVTGQVAPSSPLISRSILASAITATGQTRLGAAFPNPANPEVWMPYQLGQASEVAIRIYDATGQLIRTLELGHRPPGIYDSKSAAAHWDGRSSRGEVVPSGLYFYTLKTDDFTATRKLLIVR
ncbi:S8 family serine peptidase [Candidatus Poribacteria bacterium]|nr:S8 family serine peptidase [Candidatus Poribacteria bacterium]